MRSGNRKTHPDCCSNADAESIDVELLERNRDADGDEDVQRVDVDVVVVAAAADDDGKQRMRYQSERGLCEMILLPRSQSRDKQNVSRLYEEYE